MSGSTRLRTELDQAIVAGTAPSARNLIVTVVGDAIAPHGYDTAVGVSALGQLLDSFGVNERLVRTTLSRLVGDGILDVESVGRRSFYRIAEQAKETFVAATNRIYDSAVPTWDGRWTTVIFDDADLAVGDRSEWTAILAEHGFGSLTPTVWMSAWADGDVLIDRIDASSPKPAGSLANHAIVTVTPASLPIGGARDQRIARKVYPVDAAAADYRRFVEHFGRIDLADVETLTPEDAFKLRVLLISAYRKIRLAYESFPVELRPQPWAGDDARTLIATLYARVAATSERFLVDVLSEPDSVLVPPGFGSIGIDLTTRFGATTR